MPQSESDEDYPKGVLGGRDQAFSRDSGGAEWQSGNDPFAFEDRNQPVGGLRGEFLDCA